MTQRPENLTDLQARFAEEYLVDLNGTKAAIRAGSTADRPDQAAYEFLRNPDVQEYIQAMQAERSRATKIDAKWLLDRLAAEAQADVNDIYDEDGRIRPISEWPMIFRQGLIAGIEVEEQYDYETSDDGKRGKKRIASGRVTKFKLDSRVKRLELIGRHIGVKAFSERMEVTGKDGGPIEVAHTARDRIADRLARLAPPNPTSDDASKTD